MANNFQTEVWKDRISIEPTKRKLTKVGETTSEEYYVERADTVTEENNIGSPFCAELMNNLERRIKNMTFSSATQLSDGFLSKEDKQKLDNIAPGATYNKIDSGHGRPYNTDGQDGDIYLRYYKP